MNDRIQSITSDIQHRIDRVVECGSREIMGRLPSNRIRCPGIAGSYEGLGTITAACIRLIGQAVVIYLTVDSDDPHHSENGAFTYRADLVEFITK